MNRNEIGQEDELAVEFISSFQLHDLDNEGYPDLDNTWKAFKYSLCDESPLQYVDAGHYSLSKNPHLTFYWRPNFFHLRMASCGEQYI